MDVEAVRKAIVGKKVVAYDELVFSTIVAFEGGTVVSFAAREDDLGTYVVEASIVRKQAKRKKGRSKR